MNRQAPHPVCLRPAPPSAATRPDAGRGWHARAGQEARTGDWQSRPRDPDRDAAGVRLLALLLVNFVVGPKRREHSGQCRHLPLARHAAAIHRDVVARAEKHQQRFAGRMRICSRDAGHDCGQGGGVAAAQDVHENAIQLLRVLASRTRAASFSSAISMDWRT